MASQVAALGTDGVKHTLTVLTRSAQRDGRAELFLEEFLADDLLSLGWDAFSVAIETGDPMGRLLAAEILKVDDLEWIEFVLDAWELDQRARESITLLEASAALMRRGLELRERSGVELPIEELDWRSVRRGNLGQLLHRLGHTSEAVTLTTEALDTYRALAASDEVYLPSLATAHANLGGMLRDLRQFEAALKDTEVAVELRSRLVKEDLEAHGDDLIQSLNNLAVLFLDLRRPQEALPYLEEALAWVHLRDAADPETDYRLGMTSLHLAGAHSMLEDEGRAHEARWRAVGALKRVASERSENRHHLSMALLNQSLTLSWEGRNEEAMELAVEAVKTQESLASERPEGFEAWLALAVYRLGTYQEAAGRLEEARTSFLRAIDAWTRREARGDEDAALSRTEPQVALAQLLYGEGEPEAAAALIEEAVAVLREGLAQGKEWVRADLATTLLASGLMAWKEGDALEAIGRVAEGLTLLEEAAEAQPQDKALRAAHRAGAPLGSLLEGEPGGADAVARQWGNVHPGEPRMLPGSVLSAFAVFLFSAGRLAQATTLNAAALKEYRTREAWEVWRESFRFHLELLLVRGKYAEVERWIEECEQVGEETVEAETRVLALAYRGALAHHRGQRKEATRSYRKAVQLAGSRSGARWMYRYGDFLLDRAEVELETLSAESEEGLHRLIEAMGGGEQEEAATAALLASLLSARLSGLAGARKGEGGTGATAAGADLDGILEGLGESGYCDLPTVFVHAAGLARRSGDPARAEACLGQAREIAAGEPRPPALCDLALEEARLALLRGDRAAAAERLGEAREQADAVGYGRRTAEIAAVRRSLE